MDWGEAGSPGLTAIRGPLRCLREVELAVQLAIQRVVQQAVELGVGRLLALRTFRRMQHWAEPSRHSVGI